MEGGHNIMALLCIYIKICFRHEFEKCITVTIRSGLKASFILRPLFLEEIDLVDPVTSTVCW